MGVVSRLRRWRRNLPPLRVSPDYPDHPSGVPCPIPRRIATDARRLLPVPRGLPRFSAGSASAPSLSRPAQAHRQSPILVSVRSTPEVRVLPSAGITRPQRYHDPVRPPPGPPQASLALRPVGLLNHPKAAFVARLQPGRLPRQAACQLPDQTDNCLGGTSSSVDPRRRGALRNPC
jgi:hypothetical protein